MPFVIFLSGATRAIACGRMLINKNKTATGGHGPNLAPVPGPVELVFVSEHASATIQCEYDPCNSVTFVKARKCFSIMLLLFRKVHVKYGA